jgi:uncharacterized membrane protein
MNETANDPLPKWQEPLWAALLVVIVGAGLLTFYIGLFLAVPLAGHATWHAYRDLVPRPS